MLLKENSINGEVFSVF
uniref:Uncharacterized protein n=1 Tax=Rhizophora mucronata TaxID=61149 RepID=A0A2P2R0D8_RHIMU